MHVQLCTDSTHFPRTYGNSTEPLCLYRTHWNVVLFYLDNTITCRAAKTCWVLIPTNVFVYVAKRKYFLGFCQGKVTRSVVSKLPDRSGIYFSLISSCYAHHDWCGFYYQLWKVGPGRLLRDSRMWWIRHGKFHWWIWFFEGSYNRSDQGTWSWF